MQDHWSQQLTTINSSRASNVDSIDQPPPLPTSLPPPIDSEFLEKSDVKQQQPKPQTIFLARRKHFEHSQQPVAEEDFRDQSKKKLLINKTPEIKERKLIERENSFPTLKAYESAIVKEAKSCELQDSTSQNTYWTRYCDFLELNKDFKLTEKETSLAPRKVRKILLPFCLNLQVMEFVMTCITNLFRLPTKLFIYETNIIVF